MIHVRSVVAMLNVADVPRSVAFYARFGFEVGNTFTPNGAPKPTWAWLKCGGAQIMVTTASSPAGTVERGVIFYLYVDDVPAARDALRAAGIETGDLTRPFFAPRGQFPVKDPDGYALMVMHT